MMDMLYIRKYDPSCNFVAYKKTCQKIKLGMHYNDGTKVAPNLAKVHFSAARQVNLFTNLSPDC